jgi:hypothetical protein
VLPANRAMALLKIGRHADAEADCTMAIRCIICGAASFRTAGGQFFFKTGFPKYGRNKCLGPVPIVGTRFLLSRANSTYGRKLQRHKFTNLQHNKLSCAFLRQNIISTLRRFSLLNAEMVGLEHGVNVLWTIFAVWATLRQKTEIFSFR